MNHRMLIIAIPALLAVLLGPAGQRRAAAYCSSSITAPCTINAPGNYTLANGFGVTTSSNNGPACGYLGVGICVNTGVNNVTVDFNGNRIYASAAVLAAVYGNDGTTVRSGIIDAASYGFAQPIFVGNRARIERMQIIGTSSSQSSNYSIETQDDSVVTDNVVINSYYTGITCGADCVIEHNGVRSTISSATGVATSSGGLVEENTVVNNATDLSLGSDTGYGENILTTTPSTGVSMGNNVCAGLGC